MQPKDLDIRPIIFFIPTDIHPTSFLIYEDGERVGQVDKRTPRVGDFMHRESDTFVQSLGELRIILHESAGAAPAFCKPAIQIFNIHQVPFPAESTSHHQGIHYVSMGLKVQGCQQSYGLCFK
jgi:hypothetical protein